MTFALHGGDCRAVLPTFAEASLDACVTDPPYDLLQRSRGGSGRSNEPDNPYGRHGSHGGGFMGLAWDATGVAFEAATWREVLRVLKPGAHLLAFGGTRTFHRMTVAIEDAGFDIRDCLSWMYGTGFPKSLNVGCGRGTALKPAWEPIILARKPLAGTVAANVAEHGTGALNIDACRIPLGGESAPTGSGNGSARSKFSQVATSEGNGGNTTPDTGRWPANAVIDEEVAVMLDAQSGMSESQAASGVRRHGRSGGIMGNVGGLRDGRPEGHSDFGGASRFFYCAKVSPEERGDSDHPTMKPVALMRWLCRLVTPPGGTVLDPFTGSGTTGVAALSEGFRFVGIEREDHYREDIARPRLKATQPAMAFAASGPGQAVIP